MSVHLPNSDAHIIITGADGRDVARHRADPFPSAGGWLDITEFAQPSDLHYIESWKNGEGMWEARRETVSFS